MYCKNCNRQIPDEAAFCPYCGYAVYEDDVREIEESYRSERPVRSAKSRAKKNNTALVAALVFVALALFALLLYVGASMLKAVRSDKAVETASVSAAAETESGTANAQNGQQPSGGTNTAAPTKAPTATPIPTVTPFPTSTPFPTMAPTNTPTPLPTPEPTSAPEPTATPVPQEREAENNYYMISGSSSSYISEGTLSGLSEWQIKIARNEIFARHGRRFKDPDLQAYFDSQAWYSGTIPADSFDPGVLSGVEIDNLNTIRNYEHRMGYNGQ